MGTRPHPSAAPRTADFVLTTDELRAVTAFALASAVEALPLFEALRPDDGRPRAALEAAASFVGGEPRSRAQRTTAPAAHRAGKEAASPVALHAAMAAGDAAASAYLHPLADAAQVGHILRASAHAIRAFELRPGSTGAAGSSVEHCADLATPLLVEVLHRYPRTGPGRTRTAQLVHELDTRLRSRRPDPGTRPARAAERR